jgi:hypothetical protein
MSKTQTQSIAKAETDLASLIKNANAGDKESLAVLRRELSSDNAQRLLNIAGDLARNLEESTLNAMLGDQQEGAKLILLKKLSHMRDELGWNESPKLERILIERVCQTWLLVHWLETANAQAKGRPIDQMEYESNRIERAECRHLRAVKMLATVRKMALPLRIDMKAELTLAASKSSEREK